MREHREHNVAFNLVQQPKSPGCLNSMETHTLFQDFSHEGPRSIMDFSRSLGPALLQTFGLFFPGDLLSVVFSHQFSSATCGSVLCQESLDFFSNSGHRDLHSGKLT